MHSRYYGDKNDLHKWTTILELAKGKERIIYVAMWDGDTVSDKEIDQNVWNHFRDLKRIENLDQRIQLIVEPFHHKDRGTYFGSALKTLELRTIQGPILVFLDPDNGMETKTTPKQKHVADKEVIGIWNRLKPGDALVVYQHNDHKPNWRVEAQKKLENILSIKGVNKKEYPQVVFLFATK